MKNGNANQVLVLLFLGFMCLCGPVLASDPSEEVGRRATIAVLDFVANNVSQETGRGVSDLLSHHLWQTGRYRVMERRDVARAVADLTETTDGAWVCDEVACAADIGRSLRIRKVVIGSVSLFGDVITITVRVVDAESLDVVDTELVEAMGGESSIPAAVAHLAGMLGGTDETGSSIARAEERPGERAATLEPSVESQSFQPADSASTVDMVTMHPGARNGLSVAFGARLWQSKHKTGDNLTYSLIAAYTYDRPVGSLRMGIKIGGGGHWLELSDGGDGSGFQAAIHLTVSPYHTRDLTVSVFGGPGYMKSDYWGDGLTVGGGIGIKARILELRGMFLSAEDAMPGESLFMFEVGFGFW